MTQPGQPEQPANANASPQPFGYVTESGQPILQAPTPNHLLKLAGIKRAEYYPSRFRGPVIQTIDIGDGNTLEKYGPATIPYESGERIVITDKELAEARKLTTSIGAGGGLITYTLESLAGQIERDYPDRTIAIRGTCCSLGDPIDTVNQDANRLVVKDIETLLRDGTDRQDNTSAVTEFRHENPEINYKSQEWMVQSAQQLRERLKNSPELAADVFPVILVYDTSKHRIGYYATPLPDSAEERANIILKAYILDCPHK